MSMLASAMAASRRCLRSSSIIGSLGWLFGGGSAIELHRRLRRDQALGNIALERLCSALLGLTIATAAGREESHDVAGRERDLGALQHHLLGAVSAAHDGGVGGAGAAAMQAPGRIDRALTIDVGLAGLQHAVTHLESEPTAEAAGTAGIAAERGLVDQHRIFDLLQLHRCVA